jgi:hypothetical protein
MVMEERESDGCIMRWLLLLSPESFMLSERIH